jgi:hypothetical protein
MGNCSKGVNIYRCLKRESTQNCKYYIVGKLRDIIENSIQFFSRILSSLGKICTSFFKSDCFQIASFLLQTELRVSDAMKYSLFVDDALKQAILVYIFSKHPRGLCIPVYTDASKYSTGWRFCSIASYERYPLLGPSYRICARC